jgi:hypothetical protein
LRERHLETITDARWVVADEPTGTTVLDESNGPLSVPAETEAWNAEDGGFFLEATAVSEDDASVHREVKHFAIAQRFERYEARMAQPQST